MSLRFPPLAAPYDAALESVVKWGFEKYEVLAIVASGTIIRGTPDRRSDLDIQLLHTQPFRERVQAFHAGVPVETFVNPPSKIPDYFAEGIACRRPATAHMLATGVIIFDTDGVAAGLVAAAREMLLNPPAAKGLQERGAYGAATMFEDAADLAERDPIAAELVLARAVQELIQTRLVAEPGWLPRPKDELARLREIDPECAQFALAAYQSPSFGERLEAGRHLCLRVTGHEGFFEWISDRESV